MVVIRGEVGDKWTATVETSLIIPCIIIRVKNDWAAGEERVSPSVASRVPRGGEKREQTPQGADADDTRVTGHFSGLGTPFYPP